jgi:hypothetical protein
MRVRRLLVRVVVVALCATGGIAIVVLLTRSFDDMSWRILGTTMTISFCSLLAVPAGVLLERGLRPWLARASAALTAAAFVLTLVAIWSSPDEAAFWKPWGIVGVLALAAAQGCGIESRRRDSDSPGVRILVGGSVVTGSLLAGLGILAILAEIDSTGFYRGLGALAILNVLLLAVVAVLRRGSGPIGRLHRLRVDGKLVEEPGRDFAAAVAAAIRAAEKDGSEVRRIERA